MDYAYMRDIEEGVHVRLGTGRESEAGNKAKQLKGVARIVLVKKVDHQ